MFQGIIAPPLCLAYRAAQGAQGTSQPGSSGLCGSSRQAVINPWMHCAILQQVCCSIAGSRLPQMPWGLTSVFCFFLCFLFFNYRGIVHPPSDDEGTERTWLEPGRRPRKRVPKRSVHGKHSREGPSKCPGAKTTSPDGKAGHVMTFVCHRVRQEERHV